LLIVFLKKVALLGLIFQPDFELDIEKSKLPTDKFLFVFFGIHYSTIKEKMP